MLEFLFFFAFLCFTTHHSLLGIENSTLNSFKLVESTEIQNASLFSLTYPKKRYVNNAGDIIDIIEACPLLLRTNIHIKTTKIHAQSRKCGAMKEYLQPDINTLYNLFNSFLGVQNKEKI
jgi:hypothetical protein